MKKQTRNILIGISLISAIILLMYFGFFRQSVLDSNTAIQIEKKTFEKISETEETITYKLSVELTDSISKRFCQNRYSYPYTLSYSSFSDDYNNPSGSEAINSLTNVQEGKEVKTTEVIMPSFTAIKNMCAEPYVKESYPFDSETKRAICEVNGDRLTCDWKVDLGTSAEGSSWGGLKSSGRVFEADVTFRKKGIECISDSECSSGEECDNYNCIVIEETEQEETEETTNETEEGTGTPSEGEEQEPSTEPRGIDTGIIVAYFIVGLIIIMAIVVAVLLVRRFA